MKSLATLIKFQKVQVDEQRQLLAKLQARLSSLEDEIAALEARKHNESTLLRQHPEMGMTYGAFITWAIAQGRELEKQKQSAMRAVEIARDKMAQLYEEQKRYELAEEARLAAAAREEEKRERAFLDEVGTQGFIRKKRRGD